MVVALIKHLRLYGLICFSVAALGCTTQEAYITGQEWQRDQCNQMIDSMDRSRCIERTNMSYEDYKRQTEALTK